jgi:single-strand DNA-binding protein
MNFNKVLLMGNLTRDPQSKYLPSQTPVAEFGLAVNRRYRTQQGEDKEETLFVDCTAFGKQAEVINQYCTKGKPLFIEGRLKYDSWDDKNGGGKRSKVTVVVENFQFVGGRGDGDANGNGNGSAAGARSDSEGDQRPWRSNPGRGESKGEGRPERRRKSAEQPFGEELKFKEADIPF